MMGIVSVSVCVCCKDCVWSEYEVVSGVVSAQWQPLSWVVVPIVLLVIVVVVALLANPTPSGARFSQKLFPRHLATKANSR